MNHQGAYSPIPGEYARALGELADALVGEHPAYHDDYGDIRWNSQRGFEAAALRAPDGLGAEK